MNTMNIFANDVTKTAKGDYKSTYKYGSFYVAILNWAISYSRNLPVERTDTCYATTKAISSELTKMGVSHDQAYAEQDNGYPHWFIRINPHNDEPRTLLLDLTASQFGEHIFPQVCLGTSEELVARFGEQEFWKEIELDEGEE